MFPTILPTNRTNYLHLAVVLPVLNRIKTAFPKTEANTCLQTLADSEFYIYDHETEGKCYTHKDVVGIIHFTVENSSTNPVYFLAIDKCLLADNDRTKRCDCAVFDDQTFCFIEIKTTSSMTQRKKLRREAKNQLKIAISLFREHNVFTTEYLEAYVCLLTETKGEDSELDGIRTRPLNRASLLEEAEEFDEIGVTLFHSNFKRFA